MQEQGKAAARRSKDPRFVEKYFVGLGIDVGAGSDPFSKYLHLFPGVSQCRSWDVADGDGARLASVDDGSYDFLVSSHCLEHLDKPEFVLRNWLRVVRSGGYIVVTVPDWDMYERRQWPSRHGVGHLYAYTTSLDMPDGSHVICLPRLLAPPVWCLPATLEMLEVHRRGFDPTLPDHVDQSLGAAECCIEFVLRKR